MKKISDLIYKGQEFVVVDLGEDQVHRYGSISREYIKDGRLTQKVNGLQMCLAESVAKAIKIRQSAIDYRELADAGMSLEEIAKKMLK